MRPVPTLRALGDLVFTAFIFYTIPSLALYLIIGKQKPPD
jgi:hypothetical protein